MLRHVHLGFITLALEESSFTKFSEFQSPDFGFFRQTIRLRSSNAHIIISRRGKLAASFDVLRVEMSSSYSVIILP